jgi:REP element-mobilizing transposase RayT
MTAPRQILPGTTYLVTRRCAQRQLLLRPGRTIDAIFEYVLTVAARRHRIAVHAFCVLSNHYHLVVTDFEGTLPAFGQYLDSLVARAANTALDRSEAFWAPASYSAVTLVTPRDIIDKTAYVLANPVAAGLVPHGRDWPGLWSDPAWIDGEARECARPSVFFRETGSMPAVAHLQLTRPPGFAAAADFVAPLLDALASREADAAEAFAAAGRSFLGVAEVLGQKPTARPRRQAPDESLHKLNPRIACRDQERRIEALGRLSSFLHDYRLALKEWSRGVRDVIFPAGTYLMRLNHAACCAESG